jgi:hypothetical protein
LVVNLTGKSSETDKIFARSAAKSVGADPFLPFTPKRNVGTSAHLGNALK